MKQQTEKQIKREIKNYIYFYFFGILSVCSKKRIQEITNNTYNLIKDKDFCFDSKGHVAGTGRDLILDFITPEEKKYIYLRK